MLIILAPEHKLKTADDFDEVLCAELPEDPVLREIVLSAMCHNKCGNHGNMHAACMKDGACSKHYPQDFQDATVVNNDGKSVYRRRSPAQGGLQVQYNGETWDNRWVVPYNPYLLRRYQCHLNVEICSSIKGVKYLYKYVYKGGDRACAATTAAGETVDEIQQYQDMRSIGASEAAWTIFGFKKSNASPPVMALQVHLENCQTLRYNDAVEGDLARAVNHGPPETPLTAFFNYNLLRDTSVDQEESTYSDMPSRYTFNAKSKLWTLRIRKQQHKAIGRIYTVPTCAVRSTTPKTP